MPGDTSWDTPSPSEEREPDDATPPREIAGRYDLLDRLGSGSVAEVWRAHDRRSGATALKLLRPEQARDRAALYRFLQEASVLASIRHPRVVRAHDAGFDGEWYFVALDVAARGSLWVTMRRQGPIAPRAALRIAFEVLEALDVVHARGFVHRDVNPRNILLDANGAAILADFGLASRSGGPAGEVAGSRSYMAPEQWDGRADPRSDLYALGRTLFTALVGRRIDRGEASAAHPQIPPEVRAVLERVLQPDPTRRFTTARDMAQAVAEAHDALAARDGDRPGRWMRGFRAPASPPWPIPAVVCVTVGLVVAGFGLVALLMA